MGDCLDGGGCRFRGHFRGNNVEKQFLKRDEML